MKPWIQSYTNVPGTHRRRKKITDDGFNRGPQAVTVAALPERSLRPAFRLERSPETMYARSGDVNIAYQVIGNGPLDLVFVMGWVSHLEYFWREPSFARFLLRLASFARLNPFRQTRYRALRSRPHQRAAHA